MHSPGQRIAVSQYTETSDGVCPGQGIRGVGEAFASRRPDGECAPPLLHRRLSHPLRRLPFIESLQLAVIAFIE
jgi:hypothetical protein